METLSFSQDLTWLPDLQLLQRQLVSRLFPSEKICFDVHVLYAAGVDYTHYENRFNYRGGIRQDTLDFVYIQILDDAIAEPRESFEVSFTPTRNLYLRNNVIKVFICDNDGGM